MDNPVCEECDEEMHPGQAPDGTPTYGCDSCGWSFDVTPQKESDMAGETRDALHGVTTVFDSDGPVIERAIAEIESLRRERDRLREDEFFVEHDTLRKALAHLGMASRCESDEELGFNMGRLARRIIQHLAAKGETE